MNKIILCILVIFINCVSCQVENATKKIQYINSKDDGVDISILDEFIKEQMDSLEIPGISIAIINNAQVVYHSAIGVTNAETKSPINDNSIFEAASLTKPFFSFFALKMVEKGILDLDRPLFYYLEDESMAIDDRYYNVSARKVLNHTTGFPNWRWFDSVPEELDIARGDFYMKADPGTFTYSGEGYQYLARVIAHNNFVNMNDLAVIFKENVTDPLSIEHAYIVWDDFLYDNKVYGHKNNEVENRNWGTGLPHQHAKILNAAGGLHTEAQSYAQFLIALIKEEGLYPNSYKSMFSEQVVLPQDHRFRLKENTKAWGLGIAIEEDGENTYYKHGGNNGGFMSGFLINKETKNGYVYFVNCDKGNEFNDVLREIILK